MRKSLEDIAHMVDNNKSYPNLPEQLKPYYVYISDSGHSIMAVSTGARKLYPDADLDDLETPIPVKYVLEKGYVDLGSNILVTASYSFALGLEIEDGYDEF